jgi:putative tryptophan/tyrosine transport system substrate-binding protein
LCQFFGPVLAAKAATSTNVQQPPKFDFLVNLRTAKALGLTVPQSILLSADEVVE